MVLRGRFGLVPRPPRRPLFHPAGAREAPGWDTGILPQLAAMPVVLTYHLVGVALAPRDRRI